MYLKKIAIKNIGPISSIFVELPFYDNGNPKPIVFVGENGSGKTILQSQIVDSLYEIGSHLFDDIGIQEGLSRSYYKVSGGLNLKTGQEKGFSGLSFINNSGNIIEYLDKIGTVSKEDINELISDFTLNPGSDIGNKKQISDINDPQKKILQDEWLSGSYFYQPAYRYEEPFWKNEQFIDGSKFKENKRFINQLNKEIEIITATKDNKSYLMNLVLDFVNNPSNITDQLTWQNINNILRKIKKREDVRFGIGPRGGYRVSIIEQNPDLSIKSQLLPSIDNLSLGESVLLNLFINIIRHGDNPPKLIGEIKGIVAIDEIDVHLHTDLQNTVLPELLAMFPKVQFIITTHSPLFLLGMKKVFGEDNFEVRNLPDGEIINTERFSEFEKAYEVLKTTTKYDNEINANILSSNKPIVFVEGDYDIKYIKKASELFSKDDLLDKIQILDGDGFGNLDKIWKYFDCKISEVIPQKVLLLFDCDTNKEDRDKGKVYKRLIPSINSNPISKGIENLFSSTTIDKLKKQNSAFIDITPEIIKIKRGVEEKEDEKYEINKDEKGNICTWLCENGDATDFENFNQIFTLIETCLINNPEITNDQE